MLQIFRFAPAAANLRQFRGLFILPGDQREFAAGFSARSLLFSDLLRSHDFYAAGRSASEVHVAFAGANPRALRGWLHYPAELRELATVLPVRCPGFSFALMPRIFKPDRCSSSGLEVAGAGLHAVTPDFFAKTPGDERECTAASSLWYSTCFGALVPEACFPLRADFYSERYFCLFCLDQHASREQA